MATQEVAQMSIGISIDTGNTTKDINNINKAIRNSEKEFKNAGKGVENFENTFTGLDAKIQKTSKQLDLYNLKLDKQKESYDSLKSTLDRQVSKLNELEQTVGKNSEEWKKQAELVQKNSAKLDGLRINISQTEGEIQRLTQELEESQQSFNELGNETKTLEDRLEGISKEAELTQSEFNRLGSEIGDTGKFFTRLGADMANLASQISSAEQKVQAYEEEIEKLGNALRESQQNHKRIAAEIKETESALRQAKAIYGENSQEVQQLSTRLNGLRDDFNRVAQEINQTSDRLQTYQTDLNNTRVDLNRLGDEMRELPFDEMAQGLADASDKLEVLTGAIGGIGIASFLAGGESSNALGKIKGALGETTSEAEVTKDAVQDLSKNGFEFDEAMETLIKVKQTMIDILDPEDINNFTTYVLALSKTFDVDVNDVIKATTMMMQHFGIEGKEALDIIATGFQTGLNKSDDWIDTLWEYSVQFADMGFTAEDTFAIISNGMAEGAFNTDKLADGVKEFRIRLSEVGKAQEDALKKLGLNVKDVTSAFNEGGEAGRNMAIKVSQELMKVKDETKRNELAVALFGTMYEDVGEVVVRSLADIEKGHIDMKGTTDEVRESFEETFGARIAGIMAELKEPLMEIGESMLPILDNVAEIIKGFSEWFSSLDEGTVTSIGTFALIVAGIAPVLSGLGDMLLLAKLIGGSFGGASASAGGLTSAMGVLAGPVGIAGVVLALVGLVGMIGDNEQAILRLQEKFGAFGFFVGGVCEFISGTVQLLFGGLLIGVKTIGEAIVALISGRWKDIPDIFAKGTEQMNLNNEEGMQKLLLTTTRAMDNLRHATEAQLQGTIASMDTMLGYIPLIAEGKYRTASNTVAEQLAVMDLNQLNILQGMNDTTRMMFEGIREGMSVDAASKKVEENLKQMAAAGKIDADILQKDLTNAMDQMRNQMDIKTKEGASAVDINLKDANTKAKASADKTAQDVGQSYNNVAIEAKKGTEKLANNTDIDMKKANKAVQQSATDMYNGSKKSYSKMADVAREEGSRMYNGVTKSASKMAQSAKQSASDMYNGVTNSTRSMADKAIGDWNRVRNAYSKPIQGKVTTVKTVVNKTEQASLDKDIPKFRLPSIETYETAGGYYTSTSGQTKTIFEKANENNSFGDVSSLLKQLINIVTNGVSETIQPIVINLDGRELTRVVSRRMAHNVNKF